MGTHPIFESDFDCLTEICQLETQRLANRRQPSTPRPLSMASSSRSSWPTLKANMWCFSSTHLTSPLSAPLRSLLSPRESSSSRRSVARLLPVQLTPSSPTWPGPTRHFQGVRPLEGGRGHRLPRPVHYRSQRHASPNHNQRPASQLGQTHFRPKQIPHEFKRRSFSLKFM